MSVYTECMIPYMKGGGEDRKLRFCIGAKLCSGKANDEKQAKQICLAEPPKPPKEKSGGRSRGNCNENMIDLAACAIDKIDWDIITQATFEKHLSAALQECSCGKVKRVKREKPPMPKGIPKQMLPASLEAGQHWSRA